MSSPWNIVRLEDQPAVPWRNGGGITRVLAAWPPGGDWSWRMSVAEVERNGPFSGFEETARWLAVLDGAGVRLTIDGERHTLYPDDAPFFFDGSAACHCELAGGATQDFNLMLRRGEVSASRSRMSRVNGMHATRLEAAASHSPSSILAIVAVYAIDSLVSVLADGELLELGPACLAWKPLARPVALQLKGHALLMEIRA